MTQSTKMNFKLEIVLLCHLNRHLSLDKIWMELHTKFLKSQRYEKLFHLIS